MTVNKCTITHENVKILLISDLDVCHKNRKWENKQNTYVHREPKRNCQCEGMGCYHLWLGEKLSTWFAENTHRWTIWIVCPLYSLKDNSREPLILYDAFMWNIFEYRKGWWDEGNCDLTIILVVEGWPNILPQY